ncbi:MAG: type II toxin-antitoxin system HicB family antitoxin [Marvinbryantia sp.]|uniref:type II toxin-antitoxin system HicB family antitoxin n=1 Tax=Marvinbryantia sp. TaxID=2496532 RepID=UPI0025CD1169|nr:type II toxin-antitoxin system HicB family antitoxin [uncultured Marvinbryantia sp.]
MAKYVYPAIFTPEKEGGYSVFFPDLEGCYTCGDDLQDALFMANDVLAFVLYDYESEGREIPAPSKAENVEKSDGDFVNYIACDTVEYARMHNSRAVKKTLTIPQWLNDIAIRQDVNFSQVLQEALMEKVGAK